MIAVEYEFYFNSPGSCAFEITALTEPVTCDRKQTDFRNSKKYHFKANRTGPPVTRVHFLTGHTCIFLQDTRKSIHVLLI